VIDIQRLNSATKYPSIETYHVLDPRNGNLLENIDHKFTGKVLGTEKVNGANCRFVLLPGGDWFIGSREELIYAKGDRIINPKESIVPTLLPLVDKIFSIERSGLGTPGIETYFFEVFGSKIGGEAKNYTKSPDTTSARLFDVAWAPMVILELEREAISSWREKGGQHWSDEPYLQSYSAQAGIDLTPRVGEFPAGDLPTTIEDMQKFLNVILPRTNVVLDETANGQAEGIVFRTEDRAVIAKAKFSDYARTLDRRAGKRR
jgi:hypothetical protein